MWRIYDYVTRHFIATLSSDCKYLCTTVTFQVGTETFHYTGNTLVDAGYTEIMHWQVRVAYFTCCACLEYRVLDSVYKSNSGC